MIAVEAPTYGKKNSLRRWWVGVTDAGGCGVALWGVECWSYQVRLSVNGLILEDCVR